MFFFIATSFNRPRIKLSVRHFKQLILVWLRWVCIAIDIKSKLHSLQHLSTKYTYEENVSQELFRIFIILPLPKSCQIERVSHFYKTKHWWDSEQKFSIMRIVLQWELSIVTHAIEWRSSSWKCRRSTSISEKRTTNIDCIQLFSSRNKFNSSVGGYSLQLGMGICTA